MIFIAKFSNLYCHLTWLNEPQTASHIDQFSREHIHCVPLISITSNIFQLPFKDKHNIAQLICTVFFSYEYILFMYSRTSPHASFINLQNRISVETHSIIAPSFFGINYFHHVQDRTLSHTYHLYHTSTKFIQVFSLAALQRLPKPILPINKYITLLTLNIDCSIEYLITILVHNSYISTIMESYWTQLWSHIHLK